MQANVIKMCVLIKHDVRGGCGVQTQEALVCALLDMGQMLLLCGAEINRVEDTMTRICRAYGAQKADIFVITSDIVLTISFAGGAALTQTRRIEQSAAFDFEKLERLNALSRAVCAQPIPAQELCERLAQIRNEAPAKATRYAGSVLTAGVFTVFLGGGFSDAFCAALVGALVALLQQRVQPLFRNAAFFQLLVGFLSGSVILLAGRMIGALSVDHISIGVIMLLIPGAALTNAVREMLVGHTISGLLRLFESLLLSFMLATGFGSAMYFLGV